MKRRELLAGTGGFVALGAAGCLGAVGMDEHEASPAGVAPDVRDEAGYEQVNIDAFVVDRSFDIAGVSEEITVRNYLTEHEKGIDFGPVGTVQAAAFTVLTSPQITIAGRELNPIARMSSDELIDLIEADFDEIENIEHVSDDDIGVLDQETTESLYVADAAFNGVTVDVNIHLTESVETADDHLVTIGVYPEPVEDAESENIETLRDGIIKDID